jgi:NitT/TauT family transport system ATP-binding protein/nitrate/nitrite transport system substrate-binding protein
MMGETIRIGLLRLCDAAPVILADEAGIFGRHGVAVALCVEPSWANIADKLSYGLLEGAVMLPPLAIACAAGLRGRRTELVVPMSLSSNGNAVTLAARWAEGFGEGGIAAVVRAKRLRLAVVHGFSTHDLLLRYWLAANGVDPEGDVELTVLPPAEMVSSLAADAIDGFCAGAPWGEVAAHARLGFIAIRSQKIWRDHPEKCLALRADFCARAPDAAQGVVRALIEAGGACAETGRRAALAGLLAEGQYLDLPEAIIARGLNPRQGGPGFGTQYPDPGHEAWFAAQLGRWGKGEAGVGLYRPDLFLAAGGEVRPARVEWFCDTKP